MFLNRLLYGTKYVAIEHTHCNGKECFNLLILKQKKASFEIENEQSFVTFSEVMESISKNQHVFVVINTDKVLSKKILGAHEMNKAISIAFPNIKSTDFSIEVLPQEKHSFVSICRKEIVEEVLNNYKNNNINVIDFSLGNNIITTILSFLNQNKVYTSNAVISTEGNYIIDVLKEEPNQETYDVNGLRINSKHLNGLSGILSYYTNHKITNDNFKNTVIKLKEDFKQKRIFTSALKIGLGVIFIGLLINFLFFSNYQDQISSLTNENQVNQSYKERLLKLQGEVERKRTLVNEITNASNSRVSFYLDEIGNSIPSTILLTQISYQPLEKSITTDKEIVVESNILLITGKSSRSEDFISWRQQLQDYPWIDAVSVLSYGKGVKSKTEEFEIKIQMK